MRTPTSPPAPGRHKPELLAPAGGRAQLEAAVWAGADAVYFGLSDGLNARIRATSFAADELASTMDYLHERGVRGYLTLNTLVYDEELATAEDLVRRAALAGVDALIVQDIGLARLARAVAPRLPLHASTQMSVTDAAGVASAAALGARRVVLGRELSIDEIAAVVHEGTTQVEVFVHGALCVSYSGQCFSSEAWGGRSANRGQCAQACRLPYGLVVDGRLRDQGDLNYLLSPQDLMGIELLPRLVRAGVHAFKIEGRLKGPDYVHATVTAYREAIDTIWADHLAGRTVADERPLEVTQRRRLAQVFSRGQDVGADGLTPGFLLGPRHQSLVIGRNPRHRGLLIGRVTGVGRRGVSVQLLGPVKRGDGVVFDQGRPQAHETGGPVYQVIDADGNSLAGEIDSGDVELRFADDFALQRVHPGDRIWRTRDSAQDAGPARNQKQEQHPVVVDFHVTGALGQPLTMILSDHDGHTVTASSEAPLQAARGGALDAAKVARAIGQLGGTPYAVGHIACALEQDAPPLFLPPSEIKTMRRQAVEALLAARRVTGSAEGLAGRPVLPTLLPGPGDRAVADATPPETAFSLLCRTREQVDAALALDGVDEIVVDFLEVHGLREAVAAVRTTGRRLVVAAPRILKPGEQRLWRYLCRLRPDALLVRSAGLLWTLQHLGGTGTPLGDGDTIPALHGDFSLNGANVLAARMLLAQGLQRLTPTHDLNAQQLAALARALPAGERARIEVVAHQHLPVFHTEYCVFARFLSDGDSYRDCGRPCERHRVHLRDPQGGDHLVQADIGCRNTVFNAAAQTAGPLLPTLRDAGIRHFRVELVDEPAAEVAGLVEAYRAAIAGHMGHEALRQRIARVPDANGHRQGVALGSLAVRLEMPREQMKKPTAR